MGKLVYIMGKSGNGKSRSMKYLDKNAFVLINPEGKDLPFGKDAPAFGVKTIVTDDADKIVSLLKSYGRDYRIIVVDDFQTVMTNEFMRRSDEFGYQKWTDIGKHAWEIANTVKELPDQCVVYIMCHTEKNDDGEEKIKTLGKLLDQNVVLESKATIVLKAGSSDGKYYFYTQTNGKDTVKSPEGMFPAYAIENDLKYVDDKIRNYYGMADAPSDDELKKADAEKAAAVQKDDGNGRRKRATQAEKFVEEQDKVVDKVADGRDEVPFEEIPEPKRERKQRDIKPSVVMAQNDMYFRDKDYYFKVAAGSPVPATEGLEVVSKEEFDQHMNNSVPAEQKFDAMPAPEPVATEEPARRRRRRV